MGNNKFKFIGVIPARGGSKRLPDKNLKLINGKSLTQIAIEEGLKSQFISKIILSSDSNKILNIGEKYNVDLDYRDESLSQDTSTTLELLQSLIHKNSFDKDEIVLVLLQPTSPLRVYEDIDKAINLFISNDADSVVTATKIPSFLSTKKMMEIDEHNKIIDFGFEPLDKSRIMIRNGPAVLVTKVKNVINNFLYGKRSYVIEMPFQRSIDIDEEEDYLVAKLIYERFIKK